MDLNFSVKMEDTEKRKGLSTVKEAIVDFCETTTVHGLYFLTYLGNKWIQLFWFVVVFIGFVGLSIHLYNIINAFLQYKTTEYS